jgi:hypothetical protein
VQFDVVAFGSRCFLEDVPKPDLPSQFDESA